MVAKTSRDDLIALLRALDVQRGDAVMAHTSVFTLGLLEDGLATLFGAFQDVLGQTGTLVVPTFTWSYRRRQVYDVRNSPTDRVIGVFSEYVRKHPDAVRSECPLFSMAAVGAEAAPLIQRTSPACFGPGSIYERLFNRGVKTIGMGVAYSRGLSGFMHLEKLAGVPYREELVLEGETIGMDGVHRRDTAVHFARVETWPAHGTANREAVGKLLEAEGAARVASLHGVEHRMLYADEWRRVVGRVLAEDLCAMAAERPQ